MITPIQIAHYHVMKKSSLSDHEITLSLNNKDFLKNLALIVKSFISSLSYSWIWNYLFGKFIKAPRCIHSILINHKEKEKFPSLIAINSKWNSLWLHLIIQALSNSTFIKEIKIWYKIYKQPNNLSCIWSKSSFNGK